MYASLLTSSFNNAVVSAVNEHIWEMLIYKEFIWKIYVFQAGTCFSTLVMKKVEHAIL